MSKEFDADLIGERIRALRKDKVLTVVQLGKILDVTHATVSMWENGRSYPSTHNLFNIAQFFNVSASYLLGLKDTKDV